MIIWKGVGVLVLILPFLLQMVLYATTTNDYASPSKPWMLAVSLIITGLVFAIGGRALNNRCRRELIDPKTGKTVRLGAGHTLFFIPVEYWGVALIPIGVAAFFLKH